MYDEFGNLKKKFRAKTQQGEVASGIPGVGRAGWEVEELGIVMDFIVLSETVFYTYQYYSWVPKYAHALGQ